MTHVWTKLAPFVSKSDSRAALNGVYVDRWAERPSYIATNGHHLLVLHAEDEAEAEVGQLISADGSRPWEGPWPLFPWQRVVPSYTSRQTVSLGYLKRVMTAEDKRVTAAHKAETATWRAAKARVDAEVKAAEKAYKRAKNQDRKTADKALIAARKAQAELGHGPTRSGVAITNGAVAGAQLWTDDSVTRFVNPRYLAQGADILLSKTTPTAILGLGDKYEPLTLENARGLYLLMPMSRT